MRRDFKQAANGIHMNIAPSSLVNGYIRFKGSPDFPVQVQTAKEQTE
jgi:hypothetical protein